MFLVWDFVLGIFVQKTCYKLVTLNLQLFIFYKNKINKNSKKNFTMYKNITETSSLMIRQKIISIYNFSNIFKEFNLQPIYNMQIYYYKKDNESLVYFFGNF